jgi:hypothetical protein
VSAQARTQNIPPSPQKTAPGGDVIYFFPEKKKKFPELTEMARTLKRKIGPKKNYPANSAKKQKVSGIG